MENPLILDRQDFKVLSSDTRVSILKLLADRRHTSSELASKLGLSAPTIAEHVDLLHQAKLIEMQDDGHKWKYYALSKKGKKLLAAEPQENILVLLTPLVIGLLGIALLGMSFLSNSFAGDTFSAGNESAMAPVLKDATGASLPPEPTMDRLAVDAAQRGEAPQESILTQINPSPIFWAGVLLLLGCGWGLYHYRDRYFRS